MWQYGVAFLENFDGVDYGRKPIIGTIKEDMECDNPMDLLMMRSSEDREICKKYSTTNNEEIKIICCSFDGYSIMYTIWEKD